MTKGTHRVKLSQRLKDIRWSAEKDAWLKANRGLGFEQAAEKIEEQDHLALVEHWDKTRYPNQRVFILEIEGEAICVPFVETEDEVFLKTMFPSRRAKKLYLRGR